MHLILIPLTGTGRREGVKGKDDPGDPVRPDLPPELMGRDKDLNPLWLSAGSKYQVDGYACIRVNCDEKALDALVARGDVKVLERDDEMKPRLTDVDRAVHMRLPDGAADDLPVKGVK